MTELHAMAAPTSWAEPPRTWSTTTLDSVSSCPRRWQLVQSTWGPYTRFPQRESPAAAEGQIVHEALDRLARACGRRGNPAIGSPGFAEALREVNFFRGFAVALIERNDQNAAHPRPGPAFILRTDPQELANRAVRLFKAQYRPGSGQAQPNARGHSIDAELSGEALHRLLVQRRALSELRLRHPVLPFVGVLDHVGWTDDGVEVVDYKTGVPREAHVVQLRRYALLWWRHTGVAPQQITARYLDGARSWSVDVETLAAVEQELHVTIGAQSRSLMERPAAAMPGLLCRWCAVRARCEPGWSSTINSRRDKTADVEVTVVTQPGPHGFSGRAPKGDEMAVVYETEKVLPPVTVGDRVRILDAAVTQDGAGVEVKAWNEVYVLPSK